MAAVNVDPATLRVLAELHGLALSEADLEALSEDLGQQLQVLDAIDGQLDLSEMETPLMFDPRWR